MRAESTWTAPLVGVCAGEMGSTSALVQQAIYGGEGCEQVVTFKRSATTETSPCLCSNAGDCTNSTTSDSPCIPSQDRPGKCNSLTNIELRWYYPGYFLPGDGGCTGGKDVWGFVWPNAGNDETVAVPCPDGQGGLYAPRHLLLIMIIILMQKVPQEFVLMGYGKWPKSCSVTVLALLKH